MIVIKLELWPCGSEERKREIGRMYVANDGEGTQERGNYDFAVCRRGSVANPLLGEASPVRAGRVEDYPREAYNVWRLIIRCLRVAFPEERWNPDKKQGSKQEIHHED